MGNISETGGVIIFLFILVIGGWASAFAIAISSSGNWQSDCDAYGMHKHGNVIYQCTKLTEKK